MRTILPSIGLLAALCFGCDKPIATSPPPAPVNKVSESATKVAAPAKLAESTTEPEVPFVIEGLTADEIIKETLSRYANLSNYVSSGTVVTDMDMSGVDPGNLPGAGKGAEAAAIVARQPKQQNVTHQFTLKLGRPDRYLIEWSTSVAMAPGMQMSRGSIWSDGTGDFLSLRDGQYSKVSSRMMAMASATGVSGGVAGTIPPIFFEEGSNPLVVANEKIRLPDEPVGEELCYVVEVALQGIMKIRYWISREEFLIRQREQKIGGETSAKISETLKKSIERSKKGSPGGKKSDMMEKMTAMMSQMKMTMTETHVKYQVDSPLKDSDFKPDLGKDAKEVPSPLGERPEPAAVAEPVVTEAAKEKP